MASEQRSVHPRQVPSDPSDARGWIIAVCNCNYAAPDRKAVSAARRGKLCCDVFSRSLPIRSPMSACPTILGSAQSLAWSSIAERNRRLREANDAFADVRFPCKIRRRDPIRIGTRTARGRDGNRHGIADDRRSSGAVLNDQRHRAAEDIGGNHNVDLIKTGVRGISPIVFDGARIELDAPNIGRDIRGGELRRSGRR